MLTSRRTLLTGLGGILLGSPAIVRASSIMKTRPIHDFGWKEVSYTFWVEDGLVSPFPLSVADEMDMLLAAAWAKYE